MFLYRLERYCLDNGQYSSMSVSNRSHSATSIKERRVFWKGYPMLKLDLNSVN